MCNRMTASLGSAGSLIRDQTILQQMLEEINFQRTKEMRQMLKDDGGFVMVQGTTYWTDLFVRHFLFQSEPQNTIDSDDLLFFVRKKHVKGTSRQMPKFETEVDVFRKDSRKLPIGDPDVDWEETVYLNLIIHQFNYTLTLAICTRTSPKELQVLRRHSQRVYASPSRRKMDTKGDGEEITYPYICFMVDNFDEVFSDIMVRDGEMVCVELVASDRDGTVQGVIFLGSIRYDALKKVYDARQSSLSSKVAQRMTFGLFSSGGPQTRCEFVRMKGPQGKGHAEMAVTKPKGSGVETPTSEPGFCATEMWDEWDEDPDDYYNYRHQRRLSDPSANLNVYSRYGWKAKGNTGNHLNGLNPIAGSVPNSSGMQYPDSFAAKARSENEGLDSLASEVSEIEAGDLRDDRPASSSDNSNNLTTKTKESRMSNVRSEIKPLKKSSGIKCNMVQTKDLIKGSDHLTKKSSNTLTTCCNCFTPNGIRKRTSIASSMGQMSDIYCRVCDNDDEEDDVMSSPACLAHVTPKHETINRTKIKYKNVLTVESVLELPNKSKINEMKPKQKSCSVTTKKIVNSPISYKDKKTIKISTKPKSSYKSNQLTKPLKKETSDKNLKTNPQMSASINNNKKVEEYELANDATTYDECGGDLLLTDDHCKMGILNDIEAKLVIRVHGEEELPATTITNSTASTDPCQISNTPTLTRRLETMVDTNNLVNSLNKRPTSVDNFSRPNINVPDTDSNFLEATNCNVTDNNTNISSRLSVSNSDCTDGIIKISSTMDDDKLLNMLDDNGNLGNRYKVNDRLNRNYFTLPRMKRMSTQCFGRPLNRPLNRVPMRTTPDGTNIYYWCNIPKKALKELDDGAYNPLWATRGFTQTFHFWKEHRRQQSTPLNAFLTYVTLPWWSIAKDLLDHRETPILTF